MPAYRRASPKLLKIGRDLYRPAHRMRTDAPQHQAEVVTTEDLLGALDPKERPARDGRGGPESHSRSDAKTDDQYSMPDADAT